MDNTISAPSEVSVFDVFSILSKHWRFIALFTTCATVAAAIYYLKRPTISTAEMLLDETKYEIQYESHTRSVYPHWHHMELGQSPLFLKRVAVEMKSRGMTDRVLSQEEMLDIFSLDDRGGKSGPVVIKAQQPSPEAAIEAAAIWAEEFSKVAPMYRARKVVQSLKKEISAFENEQLEARAVSAGLSNQLAKMSGSGTEDDLFRESLRAKLLAMDVERIASGFQMEFKNELVEHLTKIGASVTFEDADKYLKDVSSAANNALYMVQEGLNDMFSVPRILDHPSQMPAKIGAMFITALIFSSAGAVFYQWIREARQRQKMRK